MAGKESVDSSSYQR